MNILIQSAIFGFIGGITRTLVGILKHKNEKFKWGKLLFTVIASGVIGVFTGLLITSDYKLTLLAGYAGTDILEGIYKSFSVQKVYVAPSTRK